MKPTFLLLLQDQLVPDSEASINRLRIMLKKLSRSFGFKCVDIHEVKSLEQLSWTQPNSGNDGLRENIPPQV